MAAEIGALRGVMALDTGNFEDGLRGAGRSLGAFETRMQGTGQRVRRTASQMSTESVRAFRQIDQAARGSGGGLQNFGFQVQDIAVQIAGGTSATRALSQQLPQMLSGFGLWGVAIGTLSAVLIPLVGYLWDAGDATADWKKEMLDAGGSIGSVNSAVSALEGIQQQYNDAITASGGASSTAAALVISNSAKEFQARKQLLAVELQLLRIRSGEMAQGAANLQAGINAQRDAALGQTTRGMLGPGLDGMTDQTGRSLGDYVNLGPRTVAEAGVSTELVNQYAEGTKQDRLALDKLNAELALTNLTIEESTALMDTTFETLTSGNPKTKNAKSGGGGGGRGLTETAREAERVFEGTRTAAERYNLEMEKLKALHASGAIDTDTFNRAMTKLKEELSQTESAAKQLEGSFGNAFQALVTGAGSAQEVVGSLLSDLAKMLANSAFQALIGGKDGKSPVFETLAKWLGFADGAAFSNGRVTAFAAGGVVSSPTIFPMAKGAGLMGEAGPEAIMPLTRIGGKLGVRAQGGGSPTFNIDARYATEGTADMIVRALQEAAPSIVKQAVGASRGAAARGY